MENRARREMERKRTILLGVLCAVVPPIGIILVWRNRYPIAKKAIFTAGATVMLTLILTAYLAITAQAPQIRPVPVRAGLQNVQSEPTPEPMAEIIPDAFLITPAPGTEDYIAPANPNGW